MRVLHLSRFLSLAAALLAAPAAFAQATAPRPIVLKVAYPPGGPADVAARKVQAALQAALGQPVIVDNAPGASGSIGATAVLNAPPDGQTLLVTTGNDLILAPLAVAQIRYKPESYRLLTPLFPADFALVTTTQHSFAGVDELIEQGRKRRDRPLSVGSWGHGSAPHLVAADFAGATGVAVLDVPYKGAAPVMQALLSQEIDMAFVPLAASVVELIRTGRVRPIGVASLQRNPHLPEVPTLNEGKLLRNFAYTAWAGVFAPAAAPEAAIARVQKELVQIIGREEFTRFLKESAGLPIEPMTLEQAAEHYRGELEKFRRIAKAVKLEPQ